MTTITTMKRSWALEEAMLLVGQEKYLTYNPKYYEELTEVYNILKQMKEELDASSHSL